VKKSQAGGGVAVKIEHAVYQSAKMFGRHFDDKDELLSHITRQSIDVLKVKTFLLFDGNPTHVFLHILSNSRPPSKRMFLTRNGC